MQHLDTSHSGAAANSSQRLRLGRVPALAARLGARTDQAGRVLTALTSFETFDTVACPDQEITAAIPDILRLAEAALGLG